MTAERELRQAVIDWDRAMVENDPAAIGQFMADEWLIVGSDGDTMDKASLLGLIQSGVLTHSVMESADLVVRIYDATAVVIAKGISGGMYQGNPFLEAERSTNVFIRRDGKWQCVSTHLSRLEKE